jgi:hypothetical protein
MEGQHRKTVHHEAKMVELVKYLDLLSTCNSLLKWRCVSLYETLFYVKVIDST